MVVDPTGVDVYVKFGDSRSKRFQDVQLPHFVTDERTTLANGHGPFGNRAKRLNSLNICYEVSSHNWNKRVAFSKLHNCFALKLAPIHDFHMLRCYR